VKPFIVNFPLSRVYTMPIGETVVLASCHHVIAGFSEANQVEREPVYTGTNIATAVDSETWLNNTPVYLDWD
jgi:hypothetical protein